MPHSLQAYSPKAKLIIRKSRKRKEERCDIRTDYQRDRDRIIYSNSFKRLKNKTQVFFAPEGDHYITRLTHTLDVSQIARSIARCLRLNEDLAEAIALGHDIGHTPFGHAGEDAMRTCYDPSFAHYKQSLRVVEKLEKDGAYGRARVLIRQSGMVEDFAKALAAAGVKAADLIRDEMSSIREVAHEPEAAE